MITGVLLRHYKNYGNLRFIPLLDDSKHLFSIYIGNNGVGKSAILEALNTAFNNHRQWNVTQGEKKTEAYVCPVFLIPKSKVSSKVKTDIELVSNYFWSDEPDKNSNVGGTAALKEFIDYKNKLKPKFVKTHYLVMVGIEYDDPQTANFASFNKFVLSLFGGLPEEQQRHANTLKEYVFGLYDYLYIPVEESPSDLLQLQNETMQKLLNKDIMQEIEKIFNKSQAGGSIVKQINKNLDSFIDDVNEIMTGIDFEYSFASEHGNKKSLTAKDIRAKVIEAFFPLRALMVNNRRIGLLSSGEQRRAIIDVAYSTLMANKERQTEKSIVLAIDEPEISMHISNCYNQFSRLEELSRRGVQVIVTTHWYGYLPIAQNGNMHYLELNDNSTKVNSFNLYNLMEQRGYFPEDVQLKSTFDLASSLVSFMRKYNGNKWLICEGSDDKVYLEAILKGYKNLHIIPMGGCGNVIKLFQIMFGFIADKTENAQADMLFLVDTDIQRIPVAIDYSDKNLESVIRLRRLQVHDGEIRLLDPTKGGVYSQTEIEDCLDPVTYYNAIDCVIKTCGDRSLMKIWNNYEIVSSVRLSILRGDDSCIKPKDIRYLDKKQSIIEFVESNQNKYLIAQQYASLCNELDIHHALADLIVAQLGLER